MADGRRDLDEGVPSVHPGHGPGQGQPVLQLIASARVCAYSHARDGITCGYGRVWKNQTGVPNPRHSRRLD